MAKEGKLLDSDAYQYQEMLYVLNYSIKDIKRSVAKLERIDVDRIRRQIILDKTAGRNCLNVSR